MSTDSPATITLNGESTPIGGGSSIVDVLRAHGRHAEQSGIAVAVNGRVVRRAAWEETRLSDGDDVEIITAFQGG